MSSHNIPQGIAADLEQAFNSLNTLAQTLQSNIRQSLTAHQASKSSAETEDEGYVHLTRSREAYTKDVALVKMLAGVISNWKPGTQAKDVEMWRTWTAIMTERLRAVLEVDLQDGGKFNGVAKSFCKETGWAGWV